MLNIELFHKDFPEGDKNGCQKWPDDKTVEPEQGQAAKRRKQDNIIGELGIPADEDRTEKIINQTDDANPEPRQQQCVAPFTDSRQVNPPRGWARVYQ